jgi:ABC-type multidrug transport system ATPase subunit
MSYLAWTRLANLISLMDLDEPTSGLDREPIQAKAPD